MNAPTNAVTVALEAQANRMPCGFNRTGLNLAKRLAHYKVCEHPACKERLAAFREMQRILIK